MNRFHNGTSLVISNDKPQTINIPCPSQDCVRLKKRRAFWPSHVSTYRSIRSWPDCWGKYVTKNLNQGTALPLVPPDQATGQVPKTIFLFLSSNHCQNFQKSS